MTRNIILAFIVVGAIGLLLVFFYNREPVSKEAVSANDSVVEGVVATSSLPIELPPAEDYVIDEADLYVVADSQQDNSAGVVTADEKKWLILMREEEKLARDVYLTLGNTWGIRIFSNIANSEQTHTDAIKDLLIKYDLKDPVLDDTVGVFADPTMQRLYDDLVAKGNTSSLEALIVGATIEDLDIHDLDQAMAVNGKTDIEVVYQNLQKGSRNHLRAFIRQIERNGGTYVPQYISVADYEKIISSEQERGRIE